MVQVADRLTKIIEPIVSGMGYECVGVEFLSRGKLSVLRVFIDSEHGIVVDDCAKVSHQLSGALDVEDPIRGQYQLEISSPGINRPLFKAADFDRFKDHLVEIELAQVQNGRRKYTGQLKGLRETWVMLEIDGEIQEIPFDQIRKAYLAVDVFGLMQGKRNGK